MSELVYKVISCAHELLLLTQQHGAFHINSHILPKLVLSFASVFSLLLFATRIDCHTFIHAPPLLRNFLY